MSENYNDNMDMDLAPKSFIRITKEETKDVIAGPNYILVGTSYTANELRKKLANRKWSRGSIFSAFAGAGAFAVSICRFNGLFLKYLNGINVSFLTITLGFVSMMVGIYSLSILRSNGNYKGITTAFFGVVISFIAICMTLL